MAKNDYEIGLTVKGDAKDAKKVADGLDKVADAAQDAEKKLDKFDATAKSTGTSVDALDAAQRKAADAGKKAADAWAKEETAARKATKTRSAAGAAFDTLGNKLKGFLKPANLAAIGVTLLTTAIAKGVQMVNDYLDRLQALADTSRQGAENLEKLAREIDDLAQSEAGGAQNARTYAEAQREATQASSDRIAQIQRQKDAENELIDAQLAADNALVDLKASRGELTPEEAEAQKTENRRKSEDRQRANRKQVLTAAAEEAEFQLNAAHQEDITQQREAGEARQAAKDFRSLGSAEQADRIGRSDLNERIVRSIGEFNNADKSGDPERIAEAQEKRDALIEERQQAIEAHIAELDKIADTERQEADTAAQNRQAAAARHAAARAELHRFNTTGLKAYALRRQADISRQQAAQNNRTTTATPAAGTLDTASPAADAAQAAAQGADPNLANNINSTAARARAARQSNDPQLLAKTLNELKALTSHLEATATQQKQRDAAIAEINAQLAKINQSAKANRNATANRS